MMADTWYKYQNNYEVEYGKEIKGNRVIFTIDGTGEVTFMVNHCCAKGGKQRNRSINYNIPITKWLLSIWGKIKDDIGTVYCSVATGDDVPRFEIYQKLGFEPYLDEGGLEDTAERVGDDYLEDFKSSYPEYDVWDHDVWEDGCCYWLTIRYSYQTDEWDDICEEYVWDEGIEEIELFSIDLDSESLFELAQNYGVDVETNTVLVYQG